MKELQTIETFYGEGKARRSQVPLINHIHEGIAILDTIGATDRAKRAFCIHPIVQNNESIDVSWSDARDLAEDYSFFANAFLCREKNDYILWEMDTDKRESFIEIGLFDNKTPSQEVAQMLYADKIQNKKDFMVHHAATHVRAEELEAYFDTWIEYLQRNYDLHIKD